MNVPLIEMERPEARDAFLEYRKAVTGSARAKLGEAQSEYQAIDRAVMQGYKALAEGKQLLKLTDVMTAAGVVGVETRWGTVVAPALAVCRADRRHVFTGGVNNRGGCRLYGDERTPNYRELSRKRANVVEVPDGTFEDGTYHAIETLRAIVPTVPPPFRPTKDLGGYHVMWEAEWTGIAPVDPMLLKHLGGELYAVLAVWDLTELEQAILGGIRA